LVDNHNKALYPFLEISKALGQKINIVHIDAHRDNGVFQGKYLDNLD
jgi:arginase family enzyme